MGTDEFDLISRYLTPLAANEAARGLADDAAVFDVPEGFHGVVSTDALVSGVHFPCDATGDIVARALGARCRFGRYGRDTNGLSVDMGHRPRLGRYVFRPVCRCV